MASQAPTQQELERLFEEFEADVSKNYYLFFETSWPVMNVRHKQDTIIGKKGEPTAHSRK